VYDSEVYKQQGHSVTKFDMRDIAICLCLLSPLI